MWAPDSWRQRTALQQPEYADAAEVERVLAEIRTLPPLVTSWEILHLRGQLAEAAEGRQFVLQAGDCAERFVDCTPVRITNTLKVLLQMSLVLVIGARRPVIRIGRFAGQYAKPRSTNEEARDGVTPAQLSRRQHQSPRVHRRSAPARSATAAARLRTRFASRSTSSARWSKAASPTCTIPNTSISTGSRILRSRHEYHRMVQTIKDSLQFVENVLGVRAGDTDKIDFYTAHEALHLGYESAQTRQVPRRPGYFNLLTHFPWVGLRTNDPDGAHLEYFRGIENPIGIKVGQAPPRASRWRAGSRCSTPNAAPGASR